MMKSLRYSPIEDAIERGALLALFYGPNRHTVTDFVEAWNYMCWVDREAPDSIRSRALDRVLAAERERLHRLGIELPYRINGEPPIHSGMLGVVWK
jgi:hypothetical protein